VTGRGYGKNLAESHFGQRKALEHPREAGFLAGRTLADVAKTIVGHPKSGILATQSPANPCEFKPHQRKVVWANGAYADIHTSEEPDSARGPEYAWGIADEIGTWKRSVDFQGNTTWDNLQFALRAGRLPQMVAGTTPRPTASVRYLLEAGAIEGGPVVLTTGSTLENSANLPAAYIDYILDRYRGTRLERQEIHGEMLLDVEGAILSLEQINDTRVMTAPDMQRVVVGVDPAAKSKASSDNTGINVAGRCYAGELYSLADRTCKMSPDGWARRAIEAYWEYDATLMVAEDNQGGEMVGTIVRSIDPRINVQYRTATKAKHKRAHHILPYYERGEAHIVGHQPELEDQLTRFTFNGYAGDESPDNADAHVWAASEIMLGGSSTWEEMAAVNA
jgi:phage terminase large subunit-like protein